MLFSVDIISKNRKQDKTFFSSYCSFLKGNVTSHSVSLTHTQRVEAENAAVNLREVPMAAQIRQIEDNYREQPWKIMTTAYHCTKLELPFSSFFHLLDVQKKNGVDLGVNYRMSKPAVGR